MLCNECKKREATIHLTQIAGEEMAKRDLCEVCGKEYLEPVNGIPLYQWEQFAASPRDSLTARLANLVARDPRYAKDAYLFVQVGLTRSFKKHFAASEVKPPAHISGAELLEALREQAIELFGKQAKARLNGWGIFKCEDFGEIVFNLVEAGLMVKSAKDDKKDFQNGFDFDAAFPA
jgi:uncharacterized repeat protein (TIGR04138 family)